MHRTAQLFNHSVSSPSHCVDPSSLYKITFSLVTLNCCNSSFKQLLSTLTEIHPSAIPVDIGREAVHLGQDARLIEITTVIEDKLKLKIYIYYKAELSKSVPAIVGF